MTKVLMLKNAFGSINGYEIEHFKSGREYDLDDALLPAFIEQGAIKIIGDDVEEVTAQSLELARETKVLKGKKSK